MAGLGPEDTAKKEQLELGSEGPVGLPDNSGLNTTCHLPKKKALKHFNHVPSNHTPH